MPKSGADVQAVANLPAEIAHLLEEIQAKDRVVQECRTAATSRDNSLQKFLKINGAGQLNPKEETYSKAILSSYERAQIIQDEKVALSDKAALLVSLATTDLLPFFNSPLTLSP